MSHIVGDKSAFLTHVQGKVVWMATVLLLLAGCDLLYSKDDYVRDFRNFVVEVKNNSDKYSEKDWVVADKKYAKFSDELYARFNGQLTKQDQYMVGRLNGVYGALRLKGEARQLLHDARGGIDQAKGIIDGSVEGMKSR